MHHIEIYVSNLKQSREFYDLVLGLLGFSIYQDWDQGFSYRKDDFYLVFVQTKQAKLSFGFNRTHIGLNHLAFHSDSHKELMVIRDKLSAFRVNFLYGEIDKNIIFFEDPDRIKIEIVAKA